MNAAPEDDDIERLKALIALQSADLAAFQSLLEEYHAILCRSFPELPSVGERFSQLRKAHLHNYLEGLERKNPGLAARRQQIIDEYCKKDPFDYE